MNLGQIARLLSGFVLFFTLVMVVPLVVAVFEETEYDTRFSFASALGIGLAVALLLWLGGRRSSKEMYRREGLAVVGLAWLLAGGLAAIPFKWSGAIEAPVDAFFESISGLTTTGATVLGTENPDIESLPPSILIWRAMLQWIGGIGVILVFIVLLPAMGITGSRLLSSEQVGMSDESLRPRMGDQARRIFLLYILLTAACFLSYWVVGLRAFDAVAHAMTTLATGGFSTNNVSIGGYQNLGVELVAMVFMFIAGCNFLLLASVLLRGSSRKLSSTLQGIEFRGYLVLMVTIIVCMTLILWIWGEPVQDKALGFTRSYNEFGRCLRDASFQTVAILTGTGYCTAKFEYWPRPALFLLFMCMFIGGCTGSTTGGFKVLRAVICGKLLRYSLRLFVLPRSVETLKVGQDAIPMPAVITVLALLALWIVTVAAGTFVLTLDPRLDLVSAFATSLSMMSVVGPAISGVMPESGGTFELIGSIDVGPYGGYGQLKGYAKSFMCIQMILGRLEILAPLALLTPGFWRR